MRKDDKIALVCFLTLMVLPIAAPIMIVRTKKKIEECFTEEEKKLEDEYLSLRCQVKVLEAKEQTAIHKEMILDPRYNDLTKEIRELFRIKSGIKTANLNVNGVNFSYRSADPKEIDRMINNKEYEIRRIKEGVSLQIREKRTEEEKTLVSEYYKKEEEMKVVQKAARARYFKKFFKIGKEGGNKE